ncbi:hypothetical protein YC2023_041037 [Brassica napus]
MSGSMDFGVASHTSLSDSPVAHPSLFPFSGETNKYVIFGRTWCYWTFLSDFIWAWVRVVGFMGFYITGYCWWPVVLSVRKTCVTLLYDDASGIGGDGCHSHIAGIQLFLYYQWEVSCLGRSRHFP